VSSSEGGAAVDPRDWIGRTTEAEGRLAPEVAAMLAGALAHPAAPEPAVDAGAPMPWLWHWAAFPEHVALADLGPEGHARLGAFMPPVPYPRRMWAGGRLRFAGRLEIGENLQRVSRILSVEMKDRGRVPMALVTIAHAITGAGGGRVEEEQDLVYLPVPDRYDPPRPVPAPQHPQAVETVEMSEIRLFRYSAATWNAHRIHYDHAYATEVEYYPGIVVHGPMQATLLIEAGVRHAGVSPASFRYRAVHPVFAGSPLRLMCEPDSDGALALCSVAAEGHQAMQARLEWAAG
jgi:3-methylfumaryl-CoA hydratase